MLSCHTHLRLLQRDNRGHVRLSKCRQPIAALHEAFCRGRELTIYKQWRHMSFGLASIIVAERR